MSKKKTDLIVDRLNGNIRKSLPKALKAEFGDRDFKTEYNIFSMSLVTSWNEGVDKKTRDKIKLFIRGYDAAYEECMNRVSNFDNELNPNPTNKEGQK